MKFYEYSRLFFFLQIPAATRQELTRIHKDNVFTKTLMGQYLITVVCNKCNYKSVILEDFFEVFLNTSQLKQKKLRINNDYSSRKSKYNLRDRNQTKSNSTDTEESQTTGSEVKSKQKWSSTDVEVQLESSPVDNQVRKIINFDASIDTVGSDTISSTSTDRTSRSSCKNNMEESASSHESASVSDCNETDSSNNNDGVISTSTILGENICDGSSSASIVGDSSVDSNVLNNSSIGDSVVICSSDELKTDLRLKNMSNVHNPAVDTEAKSYKLGTDVSLKLSSSELSKLSDNFDSLSLAKSSQDVQSASSESSSSPGSYVKVDMEIAGDQSLSQEEISILRAEKCDNYMVEISDALNDDASADSTTEKKG